MEPSKPETSPRQKGSVRWVNMRLSRSQRILLGAIPIVLVLAIYLFAASQRHAINPSDKLLPLPGAMIDAMGTLIF